MQRNPTIEWEDFSIGKLEEFLKLSPPPLISQDKVFKQLRYVERYANDLECQSIAIERIYIDRDYIEDHSVFYSKSLYPYENCCQRVHFFSISKTQAQRDLERIINVGIKEGRQKYKSECEQFSEAAYLGFAVVKPLLGSPVGRTVLRCFPEIPAESHRENEFRRDFGCTRSYLVHFSGAKLSVRGLAFQQQDVGVSACATTAVWAALQKTSDHEKIRAATPAGITSYAVKYSLPYGRPMPSEGLSLDQMCQSINALGVAPNLFRVEDERVARGYLYSAVRSGFSFILILARGTLRHAVTVVGMKIKVDHEASSVAAYVDDVANDLLGLYIHDDRRGPYLRTTLETSGTTSPHLQLTIPSRGLAPKDKDDVWTVTHILIPMHEKIRLSFSGLRRVALRVAHAITQFPAEINIPPNVLPEDPTVTIDTFFIRAHEYVERFFLGKSQVSIESVKELSTGIPLSRYLGVVRVVAPYFDPIDILVDSTSTLHNMNVLGIVAHGTQGHTEYISRYLKSGLGCKLVT